MTKPKASRILIVDDEAELREPLARYLARHELEVVTAADAVEAMEQLRSDEFDLVMTDISMPDVSGLELLAHIKRTHPGVDVIMMTGYLDISFAIEAMRRGAYDFFTKPFNFEKILLTIDRVREQQALRAVAERYHVLERERELQTEVTLCLARAAEERDRSNIGHGKRTASWSIKLGRRLCYAEDRLERLRYASLLHDIGKIGIDDAILNKPASLDAAEYRAMKRHPEIGEYILKPSSIFGDIAPAVRSHHERYDGGGYPDGLAGEDIPLDARIITVCDYFDSITSKRPYREPAGVDEALEILIGERGRALDPTLTDLFIDMLRETLPLEELQESEAAAGDEVSARA